jgi:hypothetical protein
MMAPYRDNEPRKYAQITMTLRSIFAISAISSFFLAGCSGDVDQGSQPSEAAQPATLRIDYSHTGTAEEESFELDALVLEGPWPGAVGESVDPFGYGEYYAELRSASTGDVLASSGFASIFGEWQTTGEAKEKERTFSESLRFPMPDEPAELVVRHRQPDMSFKDVWSVSIDPAEALPWTPNPDYKTWAVMENGPPSEKVDLVLLGDGYTADQMEKWHKDARRLAETLFEQSPFKERKSDFNVWAIDTPADESGVSIPSAGKERNSPIGATYDAFGSERYVLAFDNKRWRNVAAGAPYEFVEIVVNERKYGGGGIYNLFATVAADNAFTPYVFVHEFGHHFAGLADEYYTSDVAYESDGKRVEPWGPNVTADPQSPKWADLITPGTPLPTPWPKEEFEALQHDIQGRRRELRAAGAPEEEIEALFRKEKVSTSKLLGGSAYADSVGAFEGAYYQASGYYRSQVDCIMFTRDDVSFCAACDRAIDRMIDRHAASGKNSERLD